MADVAASLGLRILRDHLVEGEGSVGSYSVFRPDKIMAHDVTAPSALEMINRAGLPFLKGADRTYLYMDHFTPPKDRESAEVCRNMREFAGRHSIMELVEWGEGICHVHLLEGGKVKKGELIVGADSHITTAGALGALGIPIGSTDLAAVMAANEFWLEVPQPLGIVFDGTPDVWCEGKDIALRMLSWLGCGGGSNRVLEIDGEIMSWLGEDQKLTIANMASESSCTSALLTSEFKEYGPLSPDWSYETEKVLVDDMGPQVALPDSPEKSQDVENVEGTVVDQVFIGSCTNSRLDDMRIAADLLRGNKVHPEVRLLVIPGSRSVYNAAQKAGYLRSIFEAGGVVAMPTCGPCAGGFLGVLAEGEVALSTSNRNFRGRMGEPTSKVYLSGTAVAAASAIKGVISHPQEVAR